MIDAPYKEYYEKLDDLLQKGPEKINSIFDISSEDSNDLKERWMYYKYKKSDDKYIFCYKKHNDLNDNNHLIERYLPLLHTAIFYEPDFYEGVFPLTKFAVCNSGEFSENDLDSIEIFYFFRKISIKGIDGYIHFAVWRRPEKKIIDFQRLINGIWETYYKLIEPKIEETLISIIVSETNKQATKAAISQVMARNSSHNIGSHVMNKLVGDLSKITITEYKYKSDIALDEIHKERFEGIDNSEEKKNVLLLEQLSIFNNYVKCRMDYLSDITYGVPLMQTSKSAKEIFEDFDKVRLLLGNISGLTDFRYQIKFEPSDKLNDLILAMPNDVLGCQALYNIIENVIRNTAKHGDKSLLPKDGIVTFTIEFKDAQYDDINISCEQKNELDALYEVTIFDDLSKHDNFEIEAKERSLFSKDVFGTSDNLTDICAIDYLVWKVNSKINDSMLNKRIALRASNLGLIEMKASASYLRKLDMFSLEDNKYHVELGSDYTNKLFNAYLEINILKAVTVREKYLGYRFFVLKPTEVLFISDDDNVKNSLKEEHIKFGIKLLGIKEFANQLFQGIVFNHQFIIYDDECVDRIIKNFKTALPLRCFKHAILRLLINPDKESVVREVWITWGEIIKNRVGCTDFEIKNAIQDQPNNNQYKLVIFDHMKTEQEREDIKSYVSNFTINNPNPTKIFFECLSSLAQEKLPHPGRLRGLEFKEYIGRLFGNRSDYKDLYAQFFDATRVKTLIIDERIQNALDELYIGIKYKVLYKFINILVPDNTEIGLSDNVITKEKFIRLLAGYKDILTNDDFVLIHYSILERVFENNKKKIDICLRIMARRCNVVVTSGRGTPAELPIEVRFIHLSSFLHAFLEVRSKHYINYILHSTRKSNKI